MKFVYLFLGCLFLFSCTQKQEYIYNETLTREYYGISEVFEETYDLFSSGEYKTSDEWSNEFARNTAIRDAENLKNRVRMAKEIVDLLKPSDAAKDVHAKVNDFFDSVSSDYANTLEFYGNINCNCPEKKDSVKNRINQIYDQISTMEDEALALQKKYFEKIGMKGAE